MFRIELADLIIQIENRFDYVRELCREYITVKQCPADLSISASAQEVRRERGRMADIIISEEEAESVIIYEKISNALPAFDAFVMHSSVVEVDGKAYCFAGGCGVGKSTHTRYWKSVLGDRLTIINGDKPIYRFRNDQLLAYGTPWCGKENWQKNTSAPLAAVCLLAQGEENEVFPVDPFTLLGEISRNFHLPGDNQVEIARLMELIDRMVTRVPVYRLRCKNDVSAAETAIAYFGLQKE